MSDVIWGSINFGYSDWYILCTEYMLACDEIPAKAVVLEMTPMEPKIKEKVRNMTEGRMEWVFITHSLPHIDNINNDNARNLRFLIPELYKESKKGDLLALIEQDVLVLKKDWVAECRKQLDEHDLVSSAGSFRGEKSRKRGKGNKPYFSIFKRKNHKILTRSVKTARGRFVTLDVVDTYQLSKHNMIKDVSHAFGNDEIWGLHARGGTNHNKKAAMMLKYYKNQDDLIELIKKVW